MDNNMVAPVDMVNIPRILVIWVSQLVQGFVYQHYEATVDGRIPAPPGMYKTLETMG